MTNELRPLQQILDDGRRPFTTAEFVEYSRLRGREDLFYFAKYIFGPLDDSGVSWFQEGLHDRIAWAWQAPNGWRDPETGRVLGRIRMGGMARGHLKTTLCTQCYAAWRLIRNPEERILIYTTNATFAADIMQYIKTTFEGGGKRGQFFLACYGDIIPADKEKDKWSQLALTIKRAGVYTDPSIRASGVGATLTGGHFTLQLVDDLVGEELPREQMKKVIRSYANLTPMYHSLKLGERRIVGTPWAFFDPLAHIRRTFPDSVAFWVPWKQDGKLIFNYADTKEAEGLRRTDPFLFSCWYDLIPRDDAKMGFQQGWFRYFRQRGHYIHELDRDGKEQRKLSIASTNVFILVDPNTGRAPGSTANDTNKRREQDYVGIVVVCVGPDNIWYIPRVIRARYNPQEFVDKIFELIGVWQPKFVAIEQVAAQRLFVHIFNQEWKKGRPMFALIPWAGGNQSKEERIKGLIPHYSNGFVYHREAETTQAAEGIGALEGELVDFPNAQFDDVSDALSAALPLVYAPGSDRAKDLRGLSVLQAHETELNALDETSARAWRLYEKERQDKLFGPREFFGPDYGPESQGME